MMLQMWALGLVGQAGVIAEGVRAWHNLCGLVLTRHMLDTCMGEEKLDFFTMNRISAFKVKKAKGFPSIQSSSRLASSGADCLRPPANNRMDRDGRRKPQANFKKRVEIRVVMV